MNIVRRLVHVLVIVLTLVIGAGAAMIIVSQTAWFKNWIRAYIVREASLYLNGPLWVGRLSGNMLFGLEMENVGVSMDGRPAVVAHDVGLDYNIWDFFTRGLSIDNIRINKPVIYLRREGDTWSLSRLIKKQEQEANRRGPARPISIDAIGVSDGSVIVDGPVGTSGVELPKRFDHLDARLTFKYEPVRYSITITHASFRGSDPAIELNALSGGIAVKDDTVFLDRLAVRTAETSLSIDGDVQQYTTRPVFHVHVSSDKLSLPELAPVLPALAGVQLQAQVDARIAGPADRLGMDVNVVSSAGRLSGTLVANVQGPDRSVRGDVSIRHLDLAPILNDPRRQSDLTADARVDLHGSTFTDLHAVRGTVSFDAPRLAAEGYAAERVRGVARLEESRMAVDARGEAYGTAATAKGSVSLPRGSEPLEFDLRGRAQHLDLRRLPGDVRVPRAATDVNADYRLAKKGHGPFLLDLRFDPSIVAGARIEKGSTAAFVIDRDRPIEYKTDATVADLDLQKIGAQFDVPALAADRYKTSVNAHITANGHGSTPEDLDLTASGNLTTASVLGGRLSDLTFDASIAHDIAHVKAVGQFADVNPAAISETPELKGTVSGTLDVDATISAVSDGLRTDNTEAAGTVTVENSTIDDVDIRHGSLTGAYRGSVAEIRALDIVGPDINVQGTGTLALTDKGSSNLTIHGDSPSLEALGKLIDQPLAGSARVDATVTGNRRELRAVGKFESFDVKYGNAGALTMSGDFTATVPDLTFADGTMKADTRATFVTVAGQKINEISGTATLHQKQLDIDLTAKEPQRSLGVAGVLVLHPDHQEVHLQRLALQTAGTTWQLAPGSSPTIDYAHDRVTVADAKLVSGTQEIVAAGSYGRPDDSLKVTLTNVDLANVDALMLREPQLGGRLNATATIHATEPPGAPATLATSMQQLPRVDAEFHVTQGSFRQFHYDTFGGTVQYRGKGLTVDTTLQQNPSTSISAKGYVPTAILTPVSEEARAAAHDAPVAAEDRVDLHIESTPIDLGLVQGFTTQLTNVTGTLQAKIDVVGSASDPHPTGLVTVQNGAFTVPAIGGLYNNLNGKIELEPDRVHVGAISLLDNHFNALNISGDLAVHENDVGAVRVFVHSDDFKVIDNRLGSLRMNADLEIGGELRAPRIEGDLGVTTGTVDLDAVLAEISDNAYATAPTEYKDPIEAPTAVASLRKTQPFTLSKALAALTMNVHLTVPDDLIVKGADLATVDSPIGLGAINVTLGGDLRATKAAGGDLVLVGPVNTIRGTYTFQGRRFDILRDGTVRFTGDSVRDLDPMLDIRTSRVIQAVEARVSIRGSLKKPEVVLESTPPLEQADILSLIVFNQPVSQLGVGEQVALAQRAVQIATGALASTLSRSIEQALNLDVFEISTASDFGGAEVTVGQQLGQNLFVKLEQGLGDQTQTNFVLEYALTKWLRLRTNVLQGSSTQQQVFQRLQGSGVDLLFFFSY